MSATSQHDDARPSTSQQDATSAQGSFMSAGPEAALLQYQASMAPQPMPQYDMSHHQPIGHHHGASAPFHLQSGYPAQDTSYMSQDASYGNHVRVGSVPAQTSTDLPDDKRRKGSAVTATNDKELREMLAKNEGRPLRDVAQEVIQKERTPMAEKTKQLFAMLW